MQVHLLEACASSKCEYGIHRRMCRGKPSLITKGFEEKYRPNLGHKNEGQAANIASCFIATTKIVRKRADEKQVDEKFSRLSPEEISILSIFHRVRKYKLHFSNRNFLKKCN